MVEVRQQLSDAAQKIAVYDLRGLKCPLPVLKTRNRLETLPSGTQLWVETTDPLSGIDIPHFCQQDGHDLLEQQQENGQFRFLICKK